MPATVEKILGQPIAIVRYYGHITTADTRAVFAQIAGLLDTYGAPLYRITCILSEDAETSFDEVMLMATISSRGIRGSATDPDVFTFLVGDHPLLDIFADAMGQAAFGGVEMPIFETVDEALLHIEELIHKDPDGGRR